MVVKELLKFFIRKIDAELFKGIELKDFETGNIEDTNEERSGKVGRKSTVDDCDKPIEKTLKDGFRHSFQCV